MKLWIVLGALNGLLAVAAGAFGAHSLKERLAARNMTDVFETGARYHMYHALAMLVVAWMATRTPSRLVPASGWCFLAGIVLFSGSLYVLSMSEIKPPWFVAPLGGSLLMVGWGLLAASAFSTTR